MLAHDRTAIKLQLSPHTKHTLCLKRRHETWLALVGLHLLEDELRAVATSDSANGFPCFMGFVNLEFDHEEAELIIMSRCS